MSETVTDVMAWALLASLAEYWENPQPNRYSHRIPGRIAGSQHDQAAADGTANPYWEIVRQMPLDTMGLSWNSGRPAPDPYFMHEGRYLADRNSLCSAYSWSIPSPGDIAWITGRLAGRGGVEPGAGGGYWAWQLARAGERHRLRARAPRRQQVRHRRALVPGHARRSRRGRAPP
jgi:hypothetical protein